MEQVVLRCPETKELLAYWNGLPRRHLVPDRKHFDPVKIPHLMPRIAILDVYSADVARFRLFGTGLVKLFGQDLTGKNYPDFYNTAARGLFNKMTMAQVALPCGRVSVVRGQFADGQRARAEILSLPLDHETAGHALAIAAVGVIEKLGIGEPVLEITDIEETAWIDIGAGVPDWLPDQ